MNGEAHMATPPCKMIKSVSLDEFYHNTTPMGLADVFPQFIRDHNDIYKISKFFEWPSKWEAGAGYKLNEMHCCPDFDW